MSADCEAVHVDRSTGTQEIRWVRYNENDFVWVPSPNRPADPVVDTTATLNLGTHPTIRVQTLTGANGTTLRLTVELNSNETLYPIAAGGLQESGSVVAANSRLEAIHPLDPSGLTSFVRCAAGVISNDTYVFADPTVSLSAVRRARVLITARKTAGAVVALAATVRIAGTTQTVGGYVDIAESFTVYPIDWDSNPLTGSAWTLDDVRQAEFGYGVFPVLGTADVGELSVLFVASNPNPTDFGKVKIWTAFDPTFSATPPAAPMEGDATLVDATFLGPHDYVPLDVGRHWFWARVYDSLYRAFGLIGPTFGDIT